MKNINKKIAILISCTFLLLAGCGKSSLSTWTDGADSKKQQITDYVERITDEKNTEDYVPVEDRIATFDMDGTILLERPESLELVVTEHRITTELKDNTELNVKLEQLKEEFSMSPQPADIWELYAEVVDGAFSGMTDDEVADYFAAFVQETPVEAFPGLKYVDTVYQPMVELIQYLQENQFEVFLVSGSMRSAIWGCIKGYNDAYPNLQIDLDRSQMIGSDVEQVWEKNSGKEDSDFGLEDRIVFGEARESTNIAMTKVYNIAKQIGKTPVFAGGNTDGDFSMLNFAKSNEYPSMAVLVWHDSNEEVEYNTSDAWRTKAKENGWELISMDKDFTQIFMKESGK